MRWADVTYHRVSTNAEPIERFLARVRETHVNGGALLACFEADDPRAFDSAQSLDLRGMDHVFVTLLNSPSVKAALPELKIGSVTAEVLKLQYTVPPGMEGELAHLLMTGGAYTKFDGTIGEARAVAEGFVGTILDGRYLDASVARSYEPWTDWFHAIAWDSTYIVQDMLARRFWLLCITDTD